MILRAGDMFGPAGDRHDLATAGSGLDREIVVWVDHDRGLVALLHARDGTWPRLANLSDVAARIEREGMILESAARLDPPWLDRELDQDERAKRDARMAAIRPILTTCPEVFDPVRRGQLIGAAARASKRSRNSIKKWLSAYYRNGRCPNALIDRYEACGHRRPGVVKEHWRKLGRKSDRDGNKPENVTPALSKEFLAATDRERAFTGEAFKIVGAYRRWKDEFCHVIVEIDGRHRAVLHDRYANKVPATYKQFVRWYCSTGQHENTAREVLGNPIYEKDNRPHRSTSTAETWAAGARFQIDATTVNFAVTSTLKRNVLLGRPYLYFVRDVWSRMIVGYYLGLQPPSEITAALALMSAFTNKDAVLRKFGFDPAVDRWVAEHVCGVLLHDGGELTGHWGDWLAGRLSITFEQASAERGDLKGAVESLFQWSDVEWSRTTLGRVRSPRYRSRSMRKDDMDLAAQGKLDTIWEFERKVIDFILNWNNNHVLSGYDADPDMVAAGVARVPTDMFEWGIPSRGAPKKFDDDYIRFHMMPRAKAPVYPEGIKWQDAFFSCPQLERLKAEAARTGRVRTVQISHDLTGDRVLWHSEDSPTGYFVCELADSHRWMKDLRLEDAAAIADDRASTENQRKIEEDRIHAERAAKRRREDAERKAPEPGPAMTRAETKSANAAARREASEAERRTSFHRPADPASQKSARSASILRFPTARKSKYAAPSLEEIDDA